MSIVYLNGEYLPKEEAKISPDDRGFLLADGVYEVTPFYEGVPFGFEGHMARLRGGLAWMQIDFDVDQLDAIHRRLIAENDLSGAETALVYLQITRGVAPRTHYYPKDPVAPTVYLYAKEWARPTEDRWNQGFTAMSVPDRRWSRVDVKTIGLLPNAMAFQQAIDGGADDALLVRDGVAIEGAHMNFWAVFDGVAVTHPKSNHILPGITRGKVLDLAVAGGIPVEERPIQVEELAHAEECFWTGTTGEVKPLVEIDGRAVGDGTVGPVTRALAGAFRANIEEVKAAERRGA
jgi:D-alanine transaminase